MSDEIDVKVQAKIAGLGSGLAEAQAAVRGAVSGMKAQFASLNSMADTVKSHWMGIVAVLGGGKLFKDVIDGTLEWTTDIIQLSKRLGITTEEASGLKVALEHLHIGTDEYGTVVTKVTRQMRTNEQAFTALGIRTKESNGEWRNSQSVMSDIIERLNGMKAGTDRNVAAQALMGARVGNITQLLKLNKDMLEESAEKAKKFHLIVGPDGEAKIRAYKDAMADLHLVGKSLQVQIGNALLPVLTQLGAELGGNGPAAADFFAKAIKFVASACLEAYKAINALVESAKFLWTLMSTDISPGSGGLTVIKEAFHQMGDNVQAVNDKIDDMLLKIKFMKADPTSKSTAPNVTTLGGDDLVKGGEDPNKKLWALELAQFRLREAQAGDSMEKIVEIKREELARVRQLFGEHSTEYLGIATDLENELQKGQRDATKIFEDLQKDAAAQEKEALAERTRGWESLMSGISNAIETSVMGVIQGTQTIGAAIKNMLRSITLEYISMGVKTLIAHKAAELAKTGATAQGTAQRVALEYWAAVKSVAIGAWSAIARIAQYAVEGAAAAFKAIAAIPLVGPFLAPAAAAAAGIAIGAFAGRIASARGGYDIPSGVNPITQLHQNEMVLPSHLADKIRGMPDGGAGSGGVHFTINAIDRKGVAQFFSDHGDHIVRVIQRKERDFHFDNA